jgi:allantoinase
MSLDGGRELVSVRYSYDINDKQAFERDHRTPAEFQDMICRQFDTLYEEGEESGRVMAIVVHPYLSGQPYRIGTLDKALEHICRHAGVWLATGGEIMRHYRGQIAAT